MAICSTYDPDCYACGLRSKSIGFSGSATPTARASKKPPSTPDPAWERGFAGERRSDGSYMPYLNGQGDPMRVKEASTKRAEIRQVRRQHHNSGV